MGGEELLAMGFGSLREPSIRGWKTSNKKEFRDCFEGALYSF